MTTKLLDLQASDLLNRFGAGNATPGSGSAAALIGILAAQLLSTVVDLTQKRRSSIEHLPGFLETERALKTRIIPNLECLLQEDSDQFEKVIQCRIQRDGASDPATKKSEAAQARQTLVPATEFLLQIANDCVEIARFAFDAFDHGFKAVRGDSGVAMTAAVSTITGCLFIIELNLGQFPENQWTRKIRKTRLALRDTTNELHQQTQSRLSEQISHTERTAQFHQELRTIQTSLKGKSFLKNSAIEQLATRLQRLIWINQDLIKGNPVSNNPFKAIDPEIALKCLGFKTERPTALGNLVHRGREYKVAGQIDQKTGIVSISSQFSADIQKFTAAHELGHSLLHTQELLHRDRPLNGSDGPRDADSGERQADKFASCFLMPKKLVKSTFEQIFGSSRFQVTQKAAFNLNEGSPARLLEKCRNLRSLTVLLAAANFYNSRSFSSMAQRFGVSPEAMAIRLEELDLVEFPSFDQRAAIAHW